MKANRVHQFGPPSVITFEDVDRPRPGEGEVLVRVMAAGVGPWDALVRSGKSALDQSLPLTLGAELAGTVEEIGADADFAVGDEVFGDTNPRFVGAYAEYAVASSGMLAKKPRRLDWIESASVPVVAVTALQMLEMANIRGGETVLIHGAAGSVGAYAVQLARRKGARVIGTVLHDADYVRSLGADEVIDAGATRFEDASGVVDAVLDAVGGDTQTRSFSVLKPNGRLISSVTAPDQAEAKRRGVTASWILVDVNRSDLENIANLLDSGELKPSVGAVLPLSEAVAAHEMLAGTRPRPRGKIVLKAFA